MNNRGQSLILFVLLVPVILLIMLMVYDIGAMVLLKNELDDINYLALDYGIDHLDDDNIDSELKELIIKNKKDINININIDNEKIYIVLSDKISNKLSLINKLDTFLIKSSYVGYMEDGKKVIKKDK
mgnify:CR=1 FL=1